ncbi:hypothetical protein CKO24_01740 [Rhodothalassium salexigens DSM 2132]|nr:hypothetical protein [Rhodothalassium salexigens DSM 2132]
MPILDRPQGGHGGRGPMTIDLDQMTDAAFARLRKDNSRLTLQYLDGAQYRGRFDRRLAAFAGQARFVREFDSLDAPGALVAEDFLLAGDGADDGGDDDDAGPLRRAVLESAAEGLDFGPGERPGYGPPGGVVTLDEVLVPVVAEQPMVLLGRAVLTRLPAAADRDTADHGAAEPDAVSGFFLLERTTPPEAIKPLLSGRKLRTLRAFTEALFAPRLDQAVLSLDEIVDSIQEQVALIGRDILATVKLVLFGIERLDFFGGFSSQSLDKRQRLIRNTLLDPDSDGPFGLFRDMARLRALIYAGYYRREASYRRIGFVPPPDRPTHEGPAPERAVPTGRLTGGESFDVIVVGSGAGGAVTAYNLARQGYEVALLEAGPLVANAEITHNEAAMTAKLYEDGGLQTTANNDLVIFQAHAVGGSTVVNNAICLNLKPETLHPRARANHPFDLWAARFDIDIDRDRFYAAYDTIADFLPIREISETQAGPNGRLLLDGWAAYRQTLDDPDDRAAPAGRFRKNYRQDGYGCFQCGYCNTGCPYERKNDARGRYIHEAATRHGLKVFPRTWVDRVRLRDWWGGALKAQGVYARVPGQGGVWIGARHAVVLAGGVGATTAIMRRSGLSHNVGNQVSFNVGSPMPALYDREIGAQYGVQLATYVDLGDYLLESLFHPPLGLAVMMPGWFADHFDRMHSYDRLGSAGVLFATHNSGRARRDGAIDYVMSGEELALYKRSLATLARVHFAAGAVEVYPPSIAGATLKRGDDIEAHMDHFIRRPGDATMSSSHPQGGSPMHGRPEWGVVDARCRVHGTRNLFVTDASVFPSAIRVNAQWTTMAMAHYQSSRPDWI